MKSIFLASSFHERDKDLVGSIEKVIRAFDIEPRFGSRLEGKILEPAIKERINNSDALIALFTKREEGDDWRTHPWVLNEYGHALSIAKLAVAIVEQDILEYWSKTMYSGRERIDLDRAAFGYAIVMLVDQIGRWQKAHVETDLSSHVSTEVRRDVGVVATPEANLFIKNKLVPMLTMKENVRPNVLNEAFRTRDLALMRWTAESLLKTRLDSLDARSAASKEAELDEDYITNAEYQLFLDDKRENEDPREPDFWKSERFAEGGALKPILGVRGPGRDSDENADATEFCKWATEWRDTNRRYRVPVLADIDNSRARSRADFVISGGMDIAFWYKKSDEESGLQWEKPDSWPRYEERLFRRDPYGRRIKFSDHIYSEARVIRQLDNATDRLFLKPIEEFALSRDKNRFEKLDLRNLLQGQSAYVCGCLEKLLCSSLDVQIRDAIDNLCSEVDCISVVAKKLRDMRDTYAAEIETDCRLTEGLDVLHALVRAMSMTEFYLARKAWREYAVRLLRLRIDAHRSGQDKQDKHHWDKDKTDNILRQVYWWLRILQLREEEKFDAWEGIRIVSDRRQ